jgi:hypothetical protein
MKKLPSKVELLAKSKGSHDCHNKCLNRLIYGNEDGTPSVNAPDLNCESDSRSDETLHIYQSTMSTCIM